MKYTQHGFEDIIGRGGPSIGNENVRACVGRMEQGIADDQGEDIDSDARIVSVLFLESWIAMSRKR